MPKIMNMPKLGVNMTNAKIVAWVVKEGDTIKEGDHILDAETDKAVQEIYSAMSGVITKLLVSEGDEVLCQSPIAELVVPGEEPMADTNRLRISPLAKKLAKDMNIQLSELQPSKTGARIVKADVIAYIENSMQKDNSLPIPVRMDNAVDVKVPERLIKGTISYSGIRKIIGEKMAESKHNKPSVALTLHADVEKLIEWKNKLKKKGKPVSYNDIIVLIAAKALKEQPIINSRLVENSIELLGNINIGVAVDTDRGLIVPVIKNADQKGLLDISDEFRNKVEAARAGRILPEDLSECTFTISNLGMYEIEHFTPIINPPQCCILGLGAIIREPVVGDNDEIIIKSRMQLTLVFDHKIVDGAKAAKFLQRIKHLIEWPVGIME